MPIFARRRLQAMLDELGPQLTSGKAKDLLSRLENSDTNQALPAEVELGLLWAIGRVAHLVVEPDLPAARPDALSDDLFRSGRAIIEIAALSDDTFSGEAEMNRAANIIAQFAERVRKGSSRYLYFEFQEHSYFEGGRYHRIRLVSPRFAMAPELENALRAWLDAPDWPTSGAIRLTSEEVDVIVRRKKSVHPLFRVFSSMPAIAYDLEKNPIFRALRKKARQLSSADTGSLKCVFLGDAGCGMLRDLRSRDPTGQTKNGDQVIRHFLSRSSVDIVCAFSPVRRPSHFLGADQSSPTWNVHVYDRRQVCGDTEYIKIQSLAAALPQPRLEGYQARSLHQQRLFDPQGRGWYLGSSIREGRMSVSITISARLLQEFLAGRITLQQFQRDAFGERMPNQFDHQLKQGLTVQAVRIEKTGLDEDDDHVVFEFERDPAALPLRTLGADG